MKPKGKNYSRMNKKQQVKVDKTIKRMEKTRIKDDVRLRKSIKAKLEWAKEQKKKGLEAVEDFKKRIQTNTKELLKLEGIILVLSQILQEEQPKKEK